MNLFIAAFPIPLEMIPLKRTIAHYKYRNAPYPYINDCSKNIHRDVLEKCVACRIVFMRLLCVLLFLIVPAAQHRALGSEKIEK